MMEQFDRILAKHEDQDGILLVDHLKQVAECAVKIAGELGLNTEIARKGAILHDIGKASPLFQQTLRRGYVRPPYFRFRHEIASLFFLSLVDSSERTFVMDMIVAHHKSLSQDVRGLGLLDMEDSEEDNFAIHAQGFEEWGHEAVRILKESGLNVHYLSLEEARQNYDEAIVYYSKRRLGCSLWKGMLMAADHLASALEGRTDEALEKLFRVPDLSFYNRRSPLYPLSLVEVTDGRRHTLVTAPTGAGKTDFLLRRCRGRVFYTLPFQASINAMYDRIQEDLKGTEALVTLQHAASCVKLEGKAIEEKILHRAPGSSVKILTPHQIASIAFGIKGFEAMVTDLKGCDVILDEIHTYTSVIQAIVLKIIEILVRLKCRIHIGTATMPAVLYCRILEILGGSEEVYEVKLVPEVLDTFDRHRIYKVSSFEAMDGVIAKAIAEKQKILVVCNQVKRAQEWYEVLAERYPEVNKMLIHSRFKRGERNRLERLLRNEMNNGSEACLVVSTQVVEVSLDISFDLMITECASLDALIQRFGRINRKRVSHLEREYKPVYVIRPPEDKKEALPYDLEVLQRSYAVLPDGEVMAERDIPGLLNEVYPEVDYHFADVEMNVVFREGKWKIFELNHRPKSALLDSLDIDSVVCICESDQEKYRQAGYIERSKLEIPVSFRSIGYCGLEQLKEGMCPFIIPDRAYSREYGFLSGFARPEFYSIDNNFL